MQAPLEDRYYYLDSLRAVLMMLGVVLHSAQVFNPQGFWLISNDETSDFFHYLTEFIHTFRMPAFFFISGFFCCLTLKKYAAKRFLSVRIPRLLIPLLVTAITLNSLQAYVLTSSGWLAFNLKFYIYHGDWISHLWFLINLIVYFLLAAFFKTLGCWIPLDCKKSFCISNRVSAYLILFGLPLLSLGILALNKVGFPLYSKYLVIFDIYSLLRFSPYFIAGYLAFLYPSYFKQIINLPKAFLIAIIVVLFFVESWPIIDSAIINSIKTEYCLALKAWCLTVICLSFFHDYINRPSKIWYFLSDSSYTVYLFHHVLVVFFGLILVQIGINPFIEFFILVLVVLSSTLSIHFSIIRKLPTLRLLFNGRI